ncbi:hypothetical protein MY4824_001387 [Beauveria thailandica]
MSPTPRIKLPYHDVLYNQTTRNSDCSVCLVPAHLTVNRQPALDGPDEDNDHLLSPSSPPLSKHSSCLSRLLYVCSAAHRDMRAAAALRQRMTRDRPFDPICARPRLQLSPAAPAGNLLGRNCSVGRA